MQVEAKLEAMGLVLPAPLTAPQGMRLSFPGVRRFNDKIYISGHGPQNPDGTVAGPLGKVGRDVSLEQASLAARLTALSILGSLKRELGDLDRIRAWLRVYGMVNVDPGFTQTPLVINGFSDLILELYGAEAGSHARSAVGLAALPFDIPVEIEAEIAIYEG